MVILLYFLSYNRKHLSQCSDDMTRAGRIDGFICGIPSFAFNP